MHEYRRTFFLASGLAILATAAQAGVIFTTGTDGFTSDPVYNSTTAEAIQHQSNGNHKSVATPFSLAADATVTGLIVPLSRWAPTGLFSQGDLVDFYITPSSGQVPNTDAQGNVLGYLDKATVTPIPSATDSLFTVSFNGGVSLTAGVNYWLLANMPGVNPGAPTGVNLVDKWYSNPQSTTSHGTLVNQGTAWALSDGSYVAFTLLGDSAETGTPEPGTFALLFGGAGLLAIRRFRTRCEA